jgi:hypothetical protein
MGDLMEAVKNHSNLRITPHLMYSPKHRYGQKALIPAFHIQLIFFWSGICMVFEFYFRAVVFQKQTARACKPILAIPEEFLSSQVERDPIFAEEVRMVVGIVV